MKVERIELFHVAIPLPKPFYPAWIPGYPQTKNRFTLLRLTTDDGVQGLAAGVAFAEEREGLGGLLGPYLIGVDPTHVATVRQRLREAHRVLAPSGTLYLHVDYREVHYCKILLDQIFGRECFLNEIVWAYDYGGKTQRKWPPKHDNILVYVRRSDV